MREPIHRPAPSQLQLLEGDMEAEIMKRVSMALLLVALAFAACGAGPAAGLTDTAIQPTVLTPPDNQTPVLYPPDAEPGFRGEANVVILVEGVPFAQRWRTVRTVATELGGWVSSARTGFAEYEGDTYEFGTAVLEIRSEAFDDLLARVQELGRVISTEFSIVPTGGDDTSTVVVTLTESAAPYYSAGAGTASGPDGPRRSCSRHRRRRLVDDAQCADRGGSRAVARGRAGADRVRRMADRASSLADRRTGRVGDRNPR